MPPVGRRLPPRASPISVKTMPPRRNCHPLSVTGFSLSEKSLMKQPATALVSAAITIHPSPEKLISPPPAPPAVTISSTPRNPAMLPATFAAVSFSNRNTNAARNREKNVPAALMTEPRTPLVCASPV